MKRKDKLQIAAFIMGFGALIFAWIVYGWQLALILFLAQWASNIEDLIRREDKPSEKQYEQMAGYKSKFQQKLEEAAKKRNQ